VIDRRAVVPDECAAKAFKVTARGGGRQDTGNDGGWALPARSA